MAERFHAESAEKPKGTLVAAVIVRDGKILIEHSIKHGLRKEPPGGKVEPGESLEEALIREIQEELGITVSIIRKLGVYETDPNPEGTFDVHTFLCEIADGEPNILEPQKIGAIEWMTVESMEVDKHLVQSMRSTLPDVRKLLESPAP